MGDDKLLAELIEDIYSASLTTEDPTPTLGRVGECMGYEVVGVVTARSRYANTDCNAVWGMDLQECQQVERAHNVSLSVITRGGRELQAGEFAFREELVSDADFRAMAFYHEFVVPNRIQHGMKICLENSPDRLIFANLARPIASADPYRQRAFAQRLAPHWTRSARIFRKLQQVDVLRRAYSDMMNMAPFPAVVFDNAGAPYLVNQRAEQLLSGDGLSVASGTLSATLDAENQRLQQAIRSVVRSTNATGGTLRGADLCITRPSGKRPLQVVISPLSPGQQREGRRPAAVLIVFDPDSELEVPLKRCTEIFGFTRAEAQVALGVMRGHSLEQIAAVMGNTVATSRNLLKRVYLKAGVNRQNELARVMLHSPLLFDPSSFQPARLDSLSSWDDSISH